MCRMTKSCWLLVVPLSICTLPAQAESAGAPAVILYVDDTATGANDGSSWADAFSDLQSALDAAENSLVTPFEIRVAQGTYKPSKRTELNDARSATFQLPSNVNLVGGYKGAADPSDRNWELNPTIFSGDILGDDQPNFSNRADNVYHVFYQADDHARLTFDGIIVRGGHANAGAIGRKGGGLRAFGDVILQNSVFEDNWSGDLSTLDHDGTVAHSDGGGAVAVYSIGAPADVVPPVVWRNCIFRNNSTSAGGAGLLIGYGSLTFLYCTFENNTAYMGGAIFSDGGSERFKFLGCKFLNNSATAAHGSTAGGISLDYVEQLEIEDCLFERNAGPDGGAMHLAADTIKIIGTSFVENSASSYGGGLYVVANTSNFFNCRFERNTGKGSGAIAIGDGNVVLEDCEFTDNVDNHTSSVVSGGALSFFGGWGASLRISRSTFQRNIAPYAGGAFANSYALAAEILIEDSVFEENEARAYGGALKLSALSTTLRRCTFRGNQARLGGAVSIADFGGTVSECLFENNIASGGVAGSGGGGALYYENIVESEAVVSGSTFKGNQAGFDGGALLWNGAFKSNVEIQNCRFSNNSAAQRGGALMLDESTSTVDRCVFQNNEADDGGAIFAMYHSLDLQSSTLEDNNAVIGGGLAAAYSTVEANRCTFRNNRATVGGAVSVAEGPTSLRFSDALFSGNMATLYGGAIAGGSEGTKITRCTLASNSTWGLAAAILAGPDTVIKDSIIWNNIIINGSGLPDEQAQIEGEPTINYSIIQGWTGILGGEGNSGLDPLFVNPMGFYGNGYCCGERDFRLAADSPARNAGDPDYIADFGDTDLDGHARVLCGRVDIGAYESGFGDADCDGVVDAADLAIWVACAEGEIDGAACDAMDSDADGDFDLKDFAAIQNLH